MAYLAYKGAQPSSFFSEAVNGIYDLELSEPDIEEYCRLKETLLEKYAPEHAATIAEHAELGETAKPMERWTPKVPEEERTSLNKALMRRLVSCIGKLDQVQRDKPGNWKLWQSKLVSEQFWSSLLDAERMVSQEIDACILEAEELEPGWREHIFHQGVQCYRMHKQQEHQKQVETKAVVDAEKMKRKEVKDEVKAKEREEKRKEIEKKLEIARKVQEEKNAEKMMEKLLKEEEAASSKKGGKAKAAPKS